MKLRFEFILAVFVLAIAAMLLIPLPTPLIDVLIVLNLAFSFLILLVSLYLPNALSLLSFPTLLLLSTLFRLALNVASSRLILAQGDAGVVIEAFGTLLVGGQVAVGIIVFTIITVVNFLVIARGSARVSEVAARFALDALPGKQATIDSDLRAGVISAGEAHKRRESLRKESQLYGAMDGSMKFVQGDAIAGFLIILTNIIGGLTIALGDGMPLKEAFETYTILTVGDGLVAQVPALLIAICAGIVVTRVSSSDTATLGEDVATDLFARPAIIVAVGGLLGIFALLPGVPALPFIAVGATLVGVGLRLKTMQRATLLGVAGGGGALQQPKTQQMLSSGNGNQRLLLSGGISTATGTAASAATTSGSVPSPSESRIHIFLDRHALFSSFERNFTQAYARWRDISVVIESEFGVVIPNVWIGADVRSSSGAISVQLDGIAVFNMKVPLDALVLALEPGQAKSLGIPVVRECIDPLSGRSLSWVSNVHAAKMEPFARFDALDLAMRFAVYYLLSHPEELISIADTHAALLKVESDHPGLFDAVLDRRFINPARAAEIKRELLRAGLNVGDTRQLVEDLAHYCATYAKSELTASDFDLGDIVMHVRKLRVRELAASVQGGNGRMPLVSPIIRVMGSVAGRTISDASAREAKDAWVAQRSGNLSVTCVVGDSNVVSDARSIEAVLPHSGVLSDSELGTPEIHTAQFAVWREDAPET